MGMEMPSYRFECGEKPLGLTGRFEATHPFLSQPCRTVGIFSSVVEALVLPVVYPL